jgi:hypothetical protein
VNKPLARAAHPLSGGMPWLGRRRPANSTDGWTGTPEFPGYRAGRIVTRLTKLAAVSPTQLYLDVLLLDPRGHTLDVQGGSCASLDLRSSAEARARFVCVAAELLRHTGEDVFEFGAVAPALALLRELGVDRGPLMAAAKLLDQASTEKAVVDSLSDLLVLQLGEIEAQRSLADCLQRLARNRVIPPDLRLAASATLQQQLTLLVRSLGKHRARHVLRMAEHLDLVPDADMYHH